jgi:hypothetical protein
MSSFGDHTLTTQVCAEQFSRLGYGLFVTLCFWEHPNE